MVDLFSKDLLKNHIADTLEVGFNQYGHTLAISGVLTTRRRVVFVNSISIDLIHKNEKKSYVFDWLTFRPHRFNVGGFQGIDLQMASKFLVTPDEPFQYNIFFSDQANYLKINPVLSIINNGWEQLMEGKDPDAKKINHQNLFKQYIEKPMIQEAMKELKKANYWKSGDYRIIIIVSTRNPQGQIEYKKSFSLTEEDIRMLEQNPLAIAADLCNQTAIRYNFASVKLEDAG